MRELLQPLIKAGTTGMKMACCDGHVRHAFPLLAAYVADYPEQCLAGCTLGNRCPGCKVPRDQRGEPLKSLYRDPKEAAPVIHGAAIGDDAAIDAAEREGLRAVLNPFWKDLPHSNIFRSFTPDLLHQAHKGIFKDHLFGWCNKLSGSTLDARYKSMPSHTALRHFSHGISTIKQWTGNEYKQMERTFIGAIAGTDIPPEAIKAACALIDFIFIAQFPLHSDDDLDQMDDSLATFHTHKSIFLKSNIRSHFNIPKLHAISHYTDAIRQFGSPDGYNTESPERLHIDMAKRGYRASNRKEYFSQMAKWLTRQEAVDMCQIRHFCLKGFLKGLAVPFSTH